MAEANIQSIDKQAAVAALDNVISGLERALLGLNSMRFLLSSDAQEEEMEFDPADPANKYEVGGLEKFTDRGIEICYRLFDAGKTRYAVASLMNISFGAASHRFKAWEKAGGPNRIKQPLV